MEPNTASSLKSTEKNSIKDFVSIAGPLHVTHLVMFSRSELSPFLRICRLPHGPTLTFKILEYSLSKDIVSIQKRQNTYDKQYLTHPLVVLNNFAGEELKLKLMTSMFQNMLRKIKSPLWIRIPPLNDGKCRHRSTLCDLKPVIPVVSFLTKVFHVSGQCYDWWSPHPCSFTVNLGHLVNRVQVSCTFSKWKKSYKKDVDRRQGKCRRCCLGTEFIHFLAALGILP